MPADQTTIAPQELPVGWRFKAGVVLFTLALVPYGLVLPVVFHKLPLNTVGTLVAVGVIVQKVVFVGAVMVLGKAGFARLRGKLLHTLTPPPKVGRVRYRIGLVMLCLPFILGFLETSLSHIAPQLVANRLWVDVVSNTMLVASVFVLGGNFWDKLRALFVADARAVFPGDSSAAAAPLVG
jgi:hypothetical protein